MLRFLEYIIMEKKNVIVSWLFTVVCCLVIGSTFVPFQIMDNYFQLYPIACAVGIAFVVACLLFVMKRGKIFPFQIPDVLLLLTVGYYLLRYDYEERLADWKIYYAVLLLLFWFAIRIVLVNYAISKKVLLYGIVAMGCGQAVWGLLQLYGVLPSYHNLYAITGSFYNPGPYTGYIALFLPLCLCQALASHRKPDLYVWWLAAALFFCMIPAGMSRSAWFAVLVGVSFVLAVRFGWLARMKDFYNRRRKLFVVSVLLSVLGCVAVLVLLFIMRPASALGRLFIWKNTLSAIAKKPLFGYDPGSFPSVYGQEQSAYFAKGGYADWEAYVAGSPEYAFNEYLQWGVEGGLVLFLLATAFIYFTLRKGLQQKQYAVCAGLVVFYVFALSAYPMQVLPFGVVVILFSSLCISEYQTHIYNRVRTVLSMILCVLLLGVPVKCFIELSKVQKGKSKIIRANRLYLADMHAESFSMYEDCYIYFAHNPRLLLQYAKRLMAQEFHTKAIEVLKRAEKISNDVAILHTKASCYQELSRYDLAEICYKASISRMPIRLYPYYRLAKLYAIPAYSKPNLMKEMIQVVLSKKVKINSKAVMEMREEAQKLLNEKH